MEATGTGPEQPERKRNEEKHKETQREALNGKGNGKQQRIKIKKHYQMIRMRSNDAIV